MAKQVINAKSTINATKGVKKDDIIIVFMGLTGSGKSFFIDLLTGESEGPSQRARNGLASGTQGVEAIRVSSSAYPGRDIVLIDTPGFDGTERSDMEILRMISEWSKTTYENQVKLTGLIYLHRITDDHMAGVPQKNLRMFGELCGNIMMTQVILVTTMWERVGQAVGNMRERELKDVLWKELLDKGSKVDRLQTASFEDAWGVVGRLVEQREASKITMLQEELVDHKINFNETHAAKVLYTDLQKLLAEQKETMKSLLAHIEKSNDPHLIRELNKEYEIIQRDFERTFGEKEKLKHSLIEGLLSFFAPKKNQPISLSSIIRRVTLLTHPQKAIKTTVSSS